MFLSGPLTASSFAWLTFDRIQGDSFPGNWYFPHCRGASSVTATEHLSGMLSTMVIQAEQTLLSKLLMKVPSEGGLSCVWRMRRRAAHTTCTPTGTGRERERMKKTSGLAYRPLQLEHWWFPRLVLKDALGLRAVLPGVYLFIRGLPLVSVKRRATLSGCGVG